MAHAELLRIRVSPRSAGRLVAAIALLLFVGAFGGWGESLWLAVFLPLLVLTTSALGGCLRLARWGHAALVFAVGASLIYGWVALNPFGYWFATVGWGNDRFDSGVWCAMSARDADHTSRGRMLRSLLRDHPLKGMTITQVRELLGDSDTGPYQPPERDNRASWQYNVGLPPALSVDESYLVIDFRRGRVVGWSVLQS